MLPNYFIFILNSINEILVVTFPLYSYRKVLTCLDLLSYLCLVLEIGAHHIAQAGLRLLGLSNPPASASKRYTLPMSSLDLERSLSGPPPAF